MGFDSVRGQNLPSPIDLAGRRSHSAGATAQPVINVTQAVSIEQPSIIIFM